MKACSLITLSLLFATAASKYCLDVQGRFTPRIFLGQSALSYSTYSTSMSASSDPKELSATFNVGSFNVPRSMGIDMDSALTIIQADNVTVSTNITVDPYYEDVLQALLAYERQNLT